MDVAAERLNVATHLRPCRHEPERPARGRCPTVHFHCCVIDAVFAAGAAEQVQFREAGAPSPEDLAVVQQQVRGRVSRWFARAGHLDPRDARDVADWHHGGSFSPDGAARIEGVDCAGLERLEHIRDDQLVYRLLEHAILTEPVTSQDIAGELGPTPT